MHTRGDQNGKLTLEDWKGCINIIFSYRGCAVLLYSRDVYYSTEMLLTPRDVLTGKKDVVLY